MLDFYQHPPPRGIRTGTSDDGHPTVSYWIAPIDSTWCFMIVWLTGWTVGCLVMTYRIVFVDPFELRSLIAFPVFWAAEIGVLLYVTWGYRSRITLVFAPDELRATRSFWFYRRPRIIPKSSVREVVQIEEPGKRERDTTWGLSVVTINNILVMTGHKMEKSYWLGHVVAEWAGVEFDSAFEPAE